MKDGKIKAVEVVKDSDMVQVGGGKGKKGKKPKTQSKLSDQPKAWQLEFSMMNKFGTVHVSPPTAPEHLDTKINELNLKMNKFISEGSEIL
jgi:hypothetical protein